jgi:hypothetical protein
MHENPGPQLVWCYVVEERSPMTERGTMRSFSFGFFSNFGLRGARLSPITVWLEVRVVPVPPHICRSASISIAPALADLWTTCNKRPFHLDERTILDYTY